MCDDKQGSCGNNQGGCACGGHGMCGGWGHKSLLRVVLALVVLGFVFCAGFKLGVLAGYFHGFGYGDGPRMMYSNGWGGGMMRGFNVSVPEAATSSVIKK